LAFCFASYPLHTPISSYSSPLSAFTSFTPSLEPRTRELVIADFCGTSPDSWWEEKNGACSEPPPSTRGRRAQSWGGGRSRLLETLQQWGPSPSHCTPLAPCPVLRASQHHLAGQTHIRSQGDARRVGGGRGGVTGFYRHWRCKDLLRLDGTRSFRMAIIQSGNREEPQRELMGTEARK